MQFVNLHQKDNSGLQLRVASKENEQQADDMKCKHIERPTLSPRGVERYRSRGCSDSWEQDCDTYDNDRQAEQQWVKSESLIAKRKSA